jgi:hypothetical protein
VTCCNGYNEFDNTVDMTASLTSGSLSVGPGVYWLGLYDGPFGNTDTRDFYWETTANNATTSGQFQDQTIVNGDWFTTGQEHAFTISDATVDTSSVPEPGTWWLSLGPAGLALIVRKYRFRSNR